MKIYRLLFVLALMLVFALGFTNTVSAMTPTLSVSNNGNNSVLVSVYGDANSIVNLYYSSSYGTQSVYLGTTNYSGYFSSTISSTTYNINQGSSVYVIVNNQQSSSVSWPSYYYQNNYVNNVNNNLIISSLTIPVGGSATLSLGNNSNGIYVSNNSNSNIVRVNSSNNTSIGCNAYDQYSMITGQPCYQTLVTNYNNSNSVTLYGLASGYSTLTICANNNIGACNTLSVNVFNNIVSSNIGSVLGVSTINNSCTLYRTLKYGMYGSDVSCLKQLLANKGYLSNNTFDNYFDYETRNAVMLFQQNNYLGTDGVVGRNTRNYLY